MTRAPRACAAAVTVLALVLTGCGTATLSARRPGTPAASDPVTTTATSTAPGPVPATTAPTASPSTPRTTSPAQLRARADAAVRRLAAGQPAGSISLAALNTATGERYSYGASHGIWTASVYKLLVLEGLLLRHQRDGTWLSSSEISAATRAIENSDNKAGYQLFLDLGGRGALTDAIRDLGMSHTQAGHSDPTFTTSSGQDCLKMLQALRPGGRLDARSRAFVLGLMRQVEADQRWGIGVLAGPGASYVNKNGWLSVGDDNGPGENDDGRWAVTSVGIVTTHGQQILVAVLTSHQPSFDAGKRLVQALTRAIAPVVS